MNLGRTIQNLRKKRGFKQAAFAKKCGISQTYLSQIENNQREPNLAKLKTIAEQLNIPFPIMMFLSLDEHDVPKNKRRHFQTLAQPVKALIGEYFIPSEAA